MFNRLFSTVRSTSHSLIMKRALLIGINYTGTPNELAGCHNDVDTMQAMLRDRGFNSFTVLKDERGARRATQPTRANILHAIERFVLEAAVGDTLFMHYSGHGTSTRDTSGDEDEDGLNEAICPVDGGVITDDELQRVLVSRLPKCTLVVVLDCCHSGTGLDLRYTYTDTSTYSGGGGRVPDEFVPSEWRLSQVRHFNRKCAETVADVICFSGCLDSGTSADTVFAGRACGATTAAFQAALLHTNATVMAVAQYMNGMMRCYRYGQRPQLSLSNVALTVAAESGTLRIPL